MVTLRLGATATLLPNGTVLVAGGAAEGGLLASAELYDPDSDSWMNTGSMGEARAGATATLLPNGKVLVAGGWVFGALGGTSAELYDPRSGSWSTTGAMLEGRLSHTATLLPDGRVLAAGGVRYVSSDDGIASAELYDPATGLWTATGSMLEGHGEHTATLLPDGRVLVAGGGVHFGAPLASAELYDADAATWTATAPMTEGRAWHTATLLPDGTVLVVGGWRRGLADSPVASAEVYDPGSASWSPAANLSEGRGYHTATLLPDGTVLVAGGTGSNHEVLLSALLYHPTSGSWIPIATMIDGHATHTATLLLDGSVLVVCGVRSISGGTASPERYRLISGN